MLSLPCICGPRDACFNQRPVPDGVGELLLEEVLPPGIGAGVDAAEPPLPLPPAAGGVVSPVAHSSYESVVGLILLKKLGANGRRKHATAVLSCGFAVRLKQLVPEVQLTVETRMRQG